jgi:iron complex transport system substrate-binding protein
MIQNNSTSNPACRKWIFLTRPPLSALACLLIVFLIPISCQNAQQKSPTVKTQTSKIAFTKTEIKYAKGFDLEYHTDYKLVKTFNRSGSKIDTVVYVLIPRGNPVSKELSQFQAIEIPVKKMIGMASAHIALLDFAESADVLVGFSDFKYISSTQVRKNIKAQKVTAVGDEGAINSEAVISINPDLLMTTGGTNTNFARYQPIIKADIAVISNSEWLENTPLGRAEWVKLMAALLNKETLVNKKFAAVELEYNRLAALGNKVENKPQLIVGMPYKGSWFVPDGTSFLSKFFKDAGASYHWDKVKGTGSMGLSFETVAPIALKADFWLNTGQVDSKADIAAADNRYTYFNPYKNNTIYNCNKKSSGSLASDYWESGVVNPHIVLSDLIKILHPELLPHHQLIYYKQIL